MDRASYQVKAGDVITIKNRPNLQNLYKELKEEVSSERCGWVDFDGASLEARVSTIPSFEEVSLPVDVGQVVALMSR